MDSNSGQASFAIRTRLDIQSVANSDGSVLIVPVGSIEQHGDHLPVATDSILAEAVAADAAERVVDHLPVLVSPPVWTGHSPHHLSLGGTLSVDADVLQDVLKGIADSAVEIDFDGVLFVNGHGGNAALVDVAVSAIGTANPDLEIAAVTYFELAAPFVDDVRDSDPGGMAHAGEFETSLMLHLHPDLVNEDVIRGTPMDDPYEHGTVDLLEGGAVTSYRPFESYAESGAIGSPELATATKGETLLDSLGEELARVVTDVHEQAMK